MAHQHEEGWAVGMTVWVVPNHKVSKPREATITKIGRRWITLGGPNGLNYGRFDAVTRQLDGRGYSSPGDVYESEAHFLDATEVQKQWRDFVRCLSHTAPKHMTIEKINRLRAEVDGGHHD